MLTSTSLYRRIWRWHFYASMLVIPFVIVLSVTGVLYLFEPYEGLWLHKDKWLAKTVSTEQISYDLQLQIARDVAERDDSQAFVRKAEILNRPDSATAFYFLSPEKGEVAYFIDPSSGDYLGKLASSSRWTHTARNIHDSLLLGDFGRVILETAACWALIMMVTGIALWWPRESAKSSLRAILIPNFGLRGRLLWKEIHSKIGILIAVFVIAFVLTGLPWSTVWKIGFNKAIDVTDQTAPWSAQFGTHFKSGRINHDQPIGFDAIVEIAKEKDLLGILTITMPSDEGGAFIIRNRPAKTSQATFLVIDQYSGNIIDEANWDDFPVVQKIVATGIDLHEGRWGGVCNLVINLIIAMSLVLLSISGLIMWWKRHPNRKLGPPAYPADSSIPKKVFSIVIGMSVLFPMVGISLIVVYLMDRFFVRLVLSASVK